MGSRFGIGWHFLGRKGQHMRKSVGQAQGQVGAGGTRLHGGRRHHSLAGGTAGAAASGSPITIVMITSLTGEGSSEFSNAPAGFNARIALQNAEGGIDGHKINGVVLDDQTSPTRDRDGRPGRRLEEPGGHRVDQPPLLPGRQVPAAGGPAGDRWLLRRPGVGHAAASRTCSPPTSGSLDIKYPVNTSIGAFMKAHGGTVVCSYGYSISPSSSRSAIGTNLLVRARRRQGRACSTRPSRSARWP